MTLTPIGPGTGATLAVVIPVLAVAAILLWRALPSRQPAFAWVPWVSMLNLTFGGTATALACIASNEGSLEGSAANVVWIGLGSSVLTVWILAWAMLFVDESPQSS